MPFEVPENWEWIKLGECGDVITGMTPSKDNKLYYGGKIPFYKPTDLEQGEYTLYSSDTLSTLGFSQCRQLPCNSILVTCIGATIGKTGIIKSRGACNQQINAIVPYCFLNYQYLYYVCVSNYMQTEIRDNSSSTTLPILNKSKFSELMIPLPPLNEQFRIIRAVKDILLEIENLDRERHNLRNQIHNIKNLVIELAISGKLVPHKPLDEPATELLRRINPNYTPCDNRHCENVPNGWQFVKIKDIFTINPKNKVDDDLEAGFVSMSMIDESYRDSYQFEKKKWALIKTGFTHFKDGDIAVAKISPCLENRKSMILKNLPNGIGAGTTELHVFRSAIVYPKFALYFFKSDYFINQCVGTFNGVVGQQRVGKHIIEDIMFPLPPYEEQKRMSEKITHIFQCLDKITAEL